MKLNNDRNPCWYNFYSWMSLTWVSNLPLWFLSQKVPQSYDADWEKEQQRYLNAEIVCLCSFKNRWTFLLLCWNTEINVCEENTSSSMPYLVLAMIWWQYRAQAQRRTDRKGHGSWGRRSECYGKLQNILVVPHYRTVHTMRALISSLLTPWLNDCNAILALAYPNMTLNLFQRPSVLMEPKCLSSVQDVMTLLLSAIVSIKKDRKNLTNFLFLKDLSLELLSDEVCLPFSFHHVLPSWFITSIWQSFYKPCRNPSSETSNSENKNMYLCSLSAISSPPLSCMVAVVVLIPSTSSPTEMAQGTYCILIIRIFLWRVSLCSFYYFWLDCSSFRWLVLILPDDKNWTWEFHSTWLDFPVFLPWYRSRCLHKHFLLSYSYH